MARSFALSDTAFAGVDAKGISAADYRDRTQPTPDAVMTIDPAGTIQSFDATAEKIFGYTPAEILGQNISQLLASIETEPSRFVANYLKHHENLPGTVNEIIGRRKDKSEFPMTFGLYGIEVKGSDIFIATVRDHTQGQQTTQDLEERITVLKQTNLEQEDLIAKLTESNTDLERFAFVCAHDLREPLRMMANFAQRLELHLGKSLDERGRHYMRYITEGAKQARKLINDVLSYARIDYEDNRLEDTNSEEILWNVLHDLSERIRETGARITHDPLPPTPIQSTHLRQLLQNLISNAIKFNDAVPQVHISAQQEGDYWQFAVRDNGIGIAPEHQDKVFKIFQRIHLRDTYPGSGIGLALCQKLIQKYGGTIWLDSQPGLGSSFYFTLPKQNKHAESIV